MKRVKYLAMYGGDMIYTESQMLQKLNQFMTVIVGYLFLKERDNLLKKIISAILIIISIILIKM